VVENDREARRLANERGIRLKQEAIARQSRRRVSLEDVLARAERGEKELNLVIKADVAGSLEALADEIARLPHEQVTVNIIRDGVGGISESDVMLASASDAVVIGFNVRPVGNVGDHLIEMAMAQLFATYGIRWSLVDLDAGPRGVEATDLLVFGGGGNMGTRYGGNHALRGEALATGLPVVILPQSFTSPEDRPFARVYVREQTSLGLHPGGLQRSLQQHDGLRDIGLALGTSLIQHAGDLAIGVGLEEPERQILQLPLELPHAQTIGQRGIDIQRLARQSSALVVPDAATASAGQTEPAQRLGATGQSQHHHPDVLHHRQQHLAQDLGLRIGGAGNAPL
jgi:hypothetical protein